MVSRKPFWWFTVSCAFLSAEEHSSYRNLFLRILNKSACILRQIFHKPSIHVYISRRHAPNPSSLSEFGTEWSTLRVRIRELFDRFRLRGKKRDFKSAYFARTSKNFEVDEVSLSLTIQFSGDFYIVCRSFITQLEILSFDLLIHIFISNWKRLDPRWKPNPNVQVRCMPDFACVGALKYWYS
jgi:hypothetical protein